MTRWFQIRNPSSGGAAWGLVPTSGAVLSFGAECAPGKRREPSNQIAASMKISSPFWRSILKATSKAFSIMRALGDLGQPLTIVPAIASMFLQVEHKIVLDVHGP